MARRNYHYEGLHGIDPNSERRVQEAELDALEKGAKQRTTEREKNVNFLIELFDIQVIRDDFKTLLEDIRSGEIIIYVTNTLIPNSRFRVLDFDSKTGTVTLEGFKGKSAAARVLKVISREDKNQEE